MGEEGGKGERGYSRRGGRAKGKTTFGGSGGSYLLDNAAKKRGGKVTKNLNSILRETSVEKKYAKQNAEKP